VDQDKLFAELRNIVSETSEASDALDLVSEQVQVALAMSKIAGAMMENADEIDKLCLSADHAFGGHQFLLVYGALVNMLMVGVYHSRKVDAQRYKTAKGQRLAAIYNKAIVEYAKRGLDEMLVTTLDD
jgi:hypothetical protein